VALTLSTHADKAELLPESPGLTADRGVVSGDENDIRGVETRFWTLDRRQSDTRDAKGAAPFGSRASIVLAM